MKKWYVLDKIKTPEMTLIRYACSDLFGFHIDSLREKHERATGIGTWESTSFILYKDCKKVAEFRTLKEAKLAAEREASA